MSSAISYTQSTLIGFYRSINAMKFKRLQKNYLQESIWISTVLHVGT